MKYLNIGILAHVDAGKTSLTERLLYTAGVIDKIGSVDAGNTQTDSLQLERQRGITIKSAVASFDIGDTRVNLIDTPGHPDFIAEVERVLSVLDGVVLVISAVEGVQPQTRILMRALQRLKIPTVIFVNKIDRMGARYDDLLEEIAAKLSLEAAPMVTVGNLGHKNANVKLSIQVKPSNATPIFFGSAITGAGVVELMNTLPTLLSGANNSAQATSGTIFKIERGQRGEKIAYLRMFSGTIRARENLPFGKVVALHVYRHGQTLATTSLGAGEIGKVWGLGRAQVGDVVGEASNAISAFAPPTLEAGVVAKNAQQQAALNTALKQLAEQDPLINLRQSGQNLYVSLYGEVQKEVIAMTLAQDFGVEAAFERTQPICIERLVGTGYAVQFLQEESNPTSATVGLRIEPGQPGSGLVVRLENISPRLLPLYIYKNTSNFVGHMREYVIETLRHGLEGLEVTDCIVTITDSNYYVGDGMGKPISETPKTTAADFRALAPTILHKALQQAGTVICEPICHFTLEVPNDALARILPVLAQLRAIPSSTEPGRGVYVLRGEIPSALIHDLQQRLPDLTSGEGFLEYVFDRYEPKRGFEHR
ncbi:MAG TPA: translation factor GTPase family protein [Candidatus Saccharimonadales bacterium]|nr:translation factor GTPase family protein [Candidatus Saccharimonadales bacterium]